MRKRAIEEKAAKEGNAYIPENSSPLSQLEENILSIIGERALDSVVIKRDPLADTVGGTRVHNNNKVNRYILN